MSQSNSVAPVVLNPADWQQIQSVAAHLTPSQLTWLSGFFAGLAQGGLQAPLVAPAAEPLRVTVLFASHTGNGKTIASRLAEELTAAGAAVRLLNAREYVVRELKDEAVLLAVASTHGEGEPPDDAKSFFEFLTGPKAPKLPKLQYAVLALGDSSYPKFCQAGRDLDERLAALGAARLFARLDADVDFSASAQRFREQAVAAIRSLAPVAGPAATPVAQSVRARFDRETPWTAPVLVNQRITSSDAAKDVRHIEFSLEGSGLVYQPGDALGVWPRNDADTVTRLLAALGRSADDTLTRDDETRRLGDWLTETLEITQLSLPVLRRYVELRPVAEVAALLDDHQALAAFVSRYQLVDLLQQFGAPDDADALLASLRRLSPRLYSIASSQAETPDEVHLTVGVREYEAFGFVHRGAGSGFLAALASGDAAPVYVQSNDNFRLPAAERDIIMIGAGTGVAPFRSFIQERVATGASGRNWLFFGEQSRRSTFLYQREWLDYRQRGQLTRLSVAFSRDQAQKIYVQQRIEEEGAELFAWLEAGASVYVCGDAKQLAPAVQAALLAVIVRHGHKSETEAQDYLQHLVEQRRYLRDVY